MDWEERITADPKVLVGKPVIKGTRLAVEFVIDLLANGWTEARLLDEYPGITHEDIVACLRFANKLVKAERAGHLAVVDERRVRMRALPADD
jgi:uncharacterized protein (DUF433 family)